MSQKRAYQVLAQAIRGVFSDRDKAEDFIRMFEQTGAKIGDLDSALGHLPGPGSAFGEGQKFHTNHELYNALDKPEKSRLKELYETCVGRLVQDFPDLRKDYFLVFDR